MIKITMLLIVLGVLCVGQSSAAPQGLFSFSQVTTGNPESAETTVSTDGTRVASDEKETGSTTDGVDSEAPLTLPPFVYDRPTTPVDTIHPSNNRFKRQLDNGASQPIRTSYSQVSRFSSTTESDDDTAAEEEHYAKDSSDVADSTEEDEDVTSAKPFGGAADDEDSSHQGSSVDSSAFQRRQLLASIRNRFQSQTATEENSTTTDSTSTDNASGDSTTESASTTSASRFAFIGRPTPPPSSLVHKFGQFDDASTPPPFNGGSSTGSFGSTGTSSFGPAIAPIAGSPFGTTDQSTSTGTSESSTSFVTSGSAVVDGTSAFGSSGSFGSSGFSSQGTTAFGSSAPFGQTTEEAFRRVVPFSG